MKLQALTAKPVVDDFLENTNSSSAQESSTNIARNNAGATSQIMDSASMMAALAQGQAGAGGNTDPNGQIGKQNFLRGSNGGGSLTPQGYLASSAYFPVPQQFP
jgi:hypothetical protein